MGMVYNRKRVQGLRRSPPKEIAVWRGLAISQKSATGCD